MKKENVARGGARDRAFTLVEAIVAVAIVAILVIGVISTISSSAECQRLSRETLEAANLARAIMEETRTVSFVDLLTLHNNVVSRQGLEATIRISWADLKLMRVEVAVRRSGRSEVLVRLVTLRSVR
jgi:type II secretory pathway pseudopilin PulG